MNRTRSTLAVVLAVGAALALAPAALAGGSVHKSQVIVDGVDPLSPSFYEVFGGVGSNTRKCQANRTVELSAQASPGDPYKSFDTATTSNNGAWAGAGHMSASILPNSIKAVVTKSTYGPKSHRSTCGADSEKFTPDK